MQDVICNIVMYFWNVRWAWAAMETIAFYIIFSTTHHSAPVSKESNGAEETAWPSLNQFQERIKIIQMHF